MIPLTADGKIVAIFPESIGLCILEVQPPRQVRAAPRPSAWSGWSRRLASLWKAAMQPDGAAASFLPGRDHGAGCDAVVPGAGRRGHDLFLRCADSGIQGFDRMVRGWPMTATNPGADLPRNPRHRPRLPESAVSWISDT